MAAITQAERQRRDRLYELGLKQCNTCTEPLTLDKFSPRHDGYRGLNGTCRDCKNAQKAEYQRRNPEKVAARMRRWRAENREKRLAIEQRRDIRSRWRRAGLVSA